MMKFLDVLIFGLIRPARGRRWAAARALGIASAAAFLFGVGLTAFLLLIGNDANVIAGICFEAAAAFAWMIAADACEKERRAFIRGNRGGRPPRA